MDNLTIILVAALFILYLVLVFATILIISSKIKHKIDKFLDIKSQEIINTMTKSFEQSSDKYLSILFTTSKHELDKICEVNTKQLKTLSDNQELITQLNEILASIYKKLENINSLSDKREELEKEIIKLKNIIKRFK